ncbi:MAG TPA: sensor histidine kinase [Edaphocola sp.]|nr:sensor histidine kinase [Edaphocola sp.]
MKKIITICLLFFISLYGYGQGHPDLLTGKVRELFDKGGKCWSEGGENCIAYYQEAYRLEKKSKQNCLGCIEVELAKSYTYLEKFDTAQHYLNLAQQSLKKMNYSDKKVMHLDAEIQNNIAMNFYFIGKIDSAIVYLKKNITIIDKTGDKRSSALAKVNLASIYYSVKDYNSCISTDLKAYKELKELNMLDDPRVAVVAGNLAMAYHEINDKDASILWAKRAVEMGNANKSASAQFHGNFMMGVNLSKTKPDTALVYINTALQLAQNSGRPNFVAKAKMIKGIVLGEMKQFSEGIKNLSEAVKLMEKNPDDADYMEAIRNLGMIANEGGDYKLSAQYFKEYVLANDTLNIAKNQELIHEYQTKYETEKKEKQIAEQELKIQKQRSNLLYAILGGALLFFVLGGIFIYNRKAQQLKLKQLQQEKENAILNSFILGEERERKRISYELHDGIAAMIGAAKMSLDAIPHLPEEKRLEQFSKVQGILERTHADVRHIAHNLLPSVLEKEGLVKATIQFAAEINETNLIVISVFDKINLDHPISPQLQLMVFRVIQELVNNTIKHSQAKNAEIIFSDMPEGLVIEVSDDGVGYEANTELENQGLYSITQRLKSIGGNFKITKSNSGGTSAKVEIAV